VACRINSLGLDNVYVNNLFTDLSDGVYLLKVPTI
jgi:hypothetical protein